MRERFVPAIKTIKRGGLFVGGGIAALAIACGGGKGIEPQVQNPDTPTPIPAPTKTLEPSPTPLAKETPIPPTPELPKVTPTEAPTPVPCQVLEPKFCTQGKLVEWKSSSGRPIKLVVFGPLPDGAPIFAPVGGSFTSTQGEGNELNPNAPAITIYNPKNPNAPVFTVTGNLAFSNPPQYAVEAGDIIARTKNTGITVLGGSVAFAITAYDPKSNTRITDEEFIKTNFPHLYRK